MSFEGPRDLCLSGRCDRLIEEEMTGHWHTKSNPTSFFKEIPVLHSVTVFADLPLADGRCFFVLDESGGYADYGSG